MEPIHPDLREKWKSLGATDEDIDEYEELLARRFGAMDTETRKFYEDKLKDCKLCRQYFYANQQ